MIVAVTGYIGSGKTTTASIFHQHDFSIIEVDTLGHELLDNEGISERLKGLFGTAILDRDLKIDRDKLAKVVFSNETRLKKLNEIMHPSLIELVRERVASATGDVVIDVALFVELEIEKLCDKAILVTTDVDKVYERMAPHYTKEEILTVMNNQQLIKNSDHTVDNNGTLQQLKSRIEQLIESLT